MSLPGDFVYSISAIAPHSSGDCYAVGIRSPAASSDGALEPEMFIARVSPMGDISYLTTIPGRFGYLPPNIVVDAEGAAVTVGSTLSSDRSSTSAFVAKLGSNGELLFETEIPGASHAYAAAIGPGGRIFVTGYTTRTDLATTPDAIQKEKKPGQGNLSSDAYLAVLSADGSQVLYATYLGGIGDRCLGSVSSCLYRASNADEGRAIALDAAGSIYLAGITTSDDFPVTQGNPDVLQGDRSFLTKLSPDAKSIVYSVRFGGTALRFGVVGPLQPGEKPAGLVVDPEGRAYVAGTAYGSNFPTTDSAAERVFSGDQTAFRGSDGYVIQFDPAGAVAWSTFMPGDGNRRIGGLARLPSGELLVSGAWGSTVPAWFEAPPVGFLAKLAADGSALSAYREFPPGVVGGALGTTGEESLLVVGESPVDGALTRLVPRVAGFPAIASIANAASFRVAGRVSPGEIVSIFGYELAEAVVEIGGFPAPVFYAGDNQVNAAIPFGVEGRDRVEIELRTAAGASSPLSLRVQESRPELFTVDGVFAAALNEDGTINSETNPAPLGSIVALFGTGGGAYDPPLGDGEIASNELSILRLPVTAWIDYAEAPVLYAGSAPGLPAGVMQVNVRLPSVALTAAVAEAHVQVGEAMSRQVWLWFGSSPPR